jgi:hypothetical protein
MLRYYPTNISGDGYSIVLKFGIRILFVDILKAYIYITRIEG